MLVEADSARPNGAGETWCLDMTFATPKFSRNQIDKAGMILANEESPLEDVLWAFVAVDNWRASHSFPLNNFQSNLRVKVKNIQSDVLVAQWIKRLDSIKAKLTREQTSTMQLSQMQDIGGCRAIVKSLQNVRKLVGSYKRSKFNHKLKGEKDYIASPKDDGYRGYHLIYSYQSLPGQIKAYDKLRIEIQIRTKLQHAWATAVEAVGAFTRQALKSNQGSQDWLRLFILMSAVIAKIENTAPVPGTSTNLDELRAEIKELATKLYAVPTLGAHRATLNYVGALKEKKKTANYLLVHFQFEENKVMVTDFDISRSQAANTAYTEAEMSKKPGDNIVLVRVDSLRALTRAYPNFFLDTADFSALLQGVLADTPLPSLAGERAKSS